MESWWLSAFDEGYLEVYAHRDARQAAAEIAGLLPHLRGPVLDAGCGAGRHLQALRAAGLTALGFDLSRHLLHASPVRRWCARADVRQPPFATGSFGSILMLFTSFGYFDDAGNQACLAGLGRLLDRDGTLVVDLPDPDRLISTLQPLSWRATPGGWRVEERRRIVGDRVEKLVIARPPVGPPRTWQESVRLYRAADLRRLLTGTGLRVDRIWPGLRGPDDAGGRCVFWLRRADETP